MIFAFSLVFLGFMFTQPARGELGVCKCDEFGAKECDAVIAKQGDSTRCKKSGESCVNKECADYAKASCGGSCYWKGDTSKCVSVPADCTGYVWDTATEEKMCTDLTCLFDATNKKCLKAKVCGDYGETDCPANICIYNGSCKTTNECPNLTKTACEAATTRCKWGTACVALGCTDVPTACNGQSYNNGKLCNPESATSCVEVDSNSDCTAFKGKDACENGDKVCKWDTTCKQGDCTNIDANECELPRYHMIGGTATVCKLSGTACAAGVETELTETNCAINHRYAFAWKDSKCSLCASAAPDGEGNATIFALGVLSILALSF